VIATGVARLVFRDSVYTLALRHRGVRVGTSADLSILRRMTVEQVGLAPAVVVKIGEGAQRLLELLERTESANFVVVDERGGYAGMVVQSDLQTALREREAVPLLLVRDLVRPGVPRVAVSDDLASVLDAFAVHEV